MNTIQSKQNEEDLIRLLKAQRVAYSSAKNYQVVDFISICIAIVPTFLILFELDYAKILAVVGVFWTIISIFSELYRIHQTKVGAVIQEQFDVELFNISWNKILVGEQIDIARIIELSRGYSKQDLNDWYSKEIGVTLKHQIATLLCYKANAIWGMMQRKRFVNFILGATIVYYGGMILLSVFKNTGIYDFAVLLAPSLPFLIYASSTVKSQKEIMNNYEVITRSVDNLIGRFIKKGEEPELGQLRQIQDLFFIQRIIPHKVPDWFYKLFRKK